MGNILHWVIHWLAAAPAAPIPTISATVYGPASSATVYGPKEES
jgi:hypothetical protein